MKHFNRLMTFGLGFLSIGLTGRSSLPTGVVQNTSQLQALPSFQYSLVTRQGFAVQGNTDAPLAFTSSNSPCSQGAGAGDGGSQVPSADGNCWLAVFSPAGADITQFGADNTNASDSISTIQAASNTCLNVIIPSGTFTIIHPLTICSGDNQKIYGVGANSIIKIPATWVIAQLSACSAASDGASWHAVFYNPNCGGAIGTYVDRNIEYSSFVVDGSILASTLITTAAIFGRKEQNVHIHNMQCIGFADCTAHLASNDIQKDHS